MPTQVLMFGWEFPPYNSGGLGTACYGLSRALAALGARITFVLPKRLDVAAPFLDFRFADITGVTFKRVPGLLYPYVTHSNYKHLRENNAGELYGDTLIDEVFLYGERAKTVAKQALPFDVIHAHDWLSFPAGLAARAVTGRPLVLHIHATEFDRTGGGTPHPAVCAIEKEGMEQADQIIAVSQWTKNMLIKHYGIKEERINVVHNGIDVANHEDTLPALAALRARSAAIFPCSSGARPGVA